ncbi:hypothetical protein D3C76_1792350 [compost metagenome]
MRAAADLIALVRLEPVQRKFVFLRPDRDRLNPELVGSAENADCDLGSVGNKDLLYLQSALPTAI